MCFRPPSVDAESTVVCPNCGASNSLDATNCKKCGTGLDGVSEDVPPMKAPEAAAIAPTAIPARHNLPRLAPSYPELPGASSIRTNLIGSSISDGALWRFLKRGVVDRKEAIDCWYSSPVTALIQNPETGAIVGVEVERDGRKLNIAAKNGVVMALGGYENNASWTRQTIDKPKVLPAGSLYNEGDGMRMVQAAGAKIWHTNAWKSGGVGLAPEQDRMRSMGDNIEFFMRGSVVLVGGDANRYIAEDLEQRHGRVLVGGTWAVPARPDENYFVFDESQRLAMEAGEVPQPFPNWSSDLSLEVESGKVVKSDTLWGIAEAFSLDAAALKETIDAFGEAAQAGADPLGRKPENMREFDGGPYYGVEVFPVVVNTQGGPERTAKAEVVGLDGDPVPHLYAAGEFGSITARNAQGGGNLSECIVFGKIAGREAAVSKGDVPDVSSPDSAFGPGSGDGSVYDEAPDASALASGEAVGVGEGLGGPIWVKVSSEGESIASVEVLRHSEYADIGAVALDELVRRMVEAGTAEVDAVAGATVTSMGLKEAVRNALTGGE